MNFPLKKPLHKIEMKSLTIILLFTITTLISGCKGNESAIDTDPDHPQLLWTAMEETKGFIYRVIPNTRTITLYSATPEDGSFSHHGHLAYFKGIMYAYWDNHLRDENESGQRGLMAISSDQGKTWSPFQELFSPVDKRLPASEKCINTRFLTANGFIEIEEELYAITDVAEWIGENLQNRTRKGFGRLARHIFEDGSPGEIVWLTKNPPPPVEGFSQFPVADPELIRKIDQYLTLPGNEVQLNFTSPHPLSDDNHILAEPVPAWKLDNGTWVKLYRDGGIKDAKTSKESEDSRSRRNYVSFSLDNGETWTTPVRTNFPDAGARTNAGKLPDGQVYVINNFLPMDPKQGGRAMLGISLSADGLTFDRAAVIRFLPPPMRFEGRAKSVGFQYPHSVVVDDHLWIIYTVNKEDVQLTSIPLEELKKI